MNGISKNILHVEDDPDLQQYVAAILSDTVNITAVNNLKEARAALADASFDLAIVDFTLPDGSGSELVSELSARQPPIPIVVFSAHEITDTMFNVDSVFVKGRFREGELIDTVRRLCS